MDFTSITCINWTDPFSIVFAYCLIKYIRQNQAIQTFPSLDNDNKYGSGRELELQCIFSKCTVILDLGRTNLVA